MGPKFATAAEIFDLIAPLAAEPLRGATFFDLDGTLAPIVARPEDSAVPSRTRELVGRIGERYGLAGVVTGRQALEARRILGLDQLIYIGNHGFEVLMPGEEEPEPAPALAGQETVAADFAADLDADRLAGAELRTEDKGAIVALHWRGADDVPGAESVAAGIASEAEDQGLHVHRGRMVLELRPPVELDKGAGLRSLLRHSPARTAFYAGDDRTDADAFRALGEMVAAEKLDGAVRVAVIAEETPPEVGEAADIAVEGPDGLISVLEALA